MNINIDDYEKDDYFCPSCGKQGLWKEKDDGDYYTGSDYICINCNSRHKLDHGGYYADEDVVNCLRNNLDKAKP